MRETIAEAQNSKIKKQNSKMYYTTSTEHYKYFKGWFLQGFTFKKKRIRNVIF